MFHWRFGIGWWLVVLFGLPVIALLLGLIFGGSLQTADLGLVLIKHLGSIVLAVVVINLRKETVWAGFFQTRLEARFNFGVAAVLTTVDRRTDRGRHCGRCDHPSLPAHLRRHPRDRRGAADRLPILARGACVSILVGRGVTDSHPRRFGGRRASRHGGYRIPAATRRDGRAGSRGLDRRRSTEVDLVFGVEQRGIAVRAPQALVVVVLRRARALSRCIRIVLANADSICGGRQRADSKDSGQASHEHGHTTRQEAPPPSSGRGRHSAPGSTRRKSPGTERGRIRCYGLSR